ITPRQRCEPALTVRDGAAEPESEGRASAQRHGMPLEPDGSRGIPTSRQSFPSRRAAGAPPQLVRHLSWGAASAGAPPQRMPRSSWSIGLVSVRASRPSTTEAPPIDVQYGVWLSAEKYPPSTPDRAVPTPEARKNTAIICDWNTFGETFVE